MFLDNEVSRLKALYETVEKTDLESFLDEQDIKTIKREADFLYQKGKQQANAPMAYVNLVNRVIVPRSTTRYCTITVQRLHSGYDFGKWLKRIAEAMSFTESTEICIGFSFISWKPHSNERTYLFSAKALSPFKFVVDSREECLSHFQEIAKLKDSSILNKTFLNTISDNPFSTSGFCPLKIVCSYIYITK